jgi:hypothetical protein
MKLGVVRKTQWNWFQNYGVVLKETFVVLSGKRKLAQVM